MSTTALTDPALITGLVTGTLGTVALVQARTQTRLLRRRLAAGVGTAVVDPSTGLFSAASAWQCIRAEASRAHRLGRPLAIWVTRSADSELVDEHGQALLHDLPGAATGIRLSRTRLCVVSCADGLEIGMALAPELGWRQHLVPAGSDDAARDALVFVSEATRD